MFLICMYVCMYVLYVYACIHIQYRTVYVCRNAFMYTFFNLCVCRIYMNVCMYCRMTNVFDLLVGRESSAGSRRTGCSEI